MLIDLAVLVKNDCPCPEPKPKRAVRRTAPKPELRTLVVRDTVYKILWKDCAVWLGPAMTVTENTTLGGIDLGGRRESFGVRASLSGHSTTWRAASDALWFHDFSALRGYAGGGLLVECSESPHTLTIKHKHKRYDDERITVTRSDKRIGPSVVGGIESLGRNRAFAELRLWFKDEIEPSAHLGIRFNL